jgi:hypothetical protein
MLYFVIVECVNVETTALGCPAVAENKDKVLINTTKAKKEIRGRATFFLKLGTLLHTKATLLSVKSPHLAMGQVADTCECGMNLRVP